MRLIINGINIRVFKTILEIVLNKTYIRSYIFRRIFFNQIFLNIYRSYFDYLLIYIYYILILYLKISCFNKKWNFLIIDKYEYTY